MRSEKNSIIPTERQTKFVLGVLLAILIALGTVTILSLGTNIQTAVEQQTKNSLARVCSQSAKLVESQIMSRQRALRALAARIPTTGGDSLREKADSLKEYCYVFGFYNLGIFDKNGNGWTTQGEYMELGGRDYIEQALNGRQVVTESRLSESGDKSLNIFATPVRENGKVCAVLTATYRSEDFLDILNVSFMDGMGQSLVLDSQGRVVCLPGESSKDDLYDMARYISENGEIRPVAGLQTFSYNGKNYIAYSWAMEKIDWYVMAYIPEDIIDRDVAQLKRSIVLALAVLYLCMLAAAGICLKTYRNLSDRIMSAAFEDELTHAKNYEYLKVYFRQMTAEEKSRRFLVVFDIDKFKFVNILYGNDAGDRLLQFILYHFQKILSREMIFKANADVFIAVMDGDSRAEIREKILLLDKHLKIAAEEASMFPFRLSYGVCRLDVNEELRSIYDNALLAKKEAKVSIGQKYKFYDSIERQKVRQRAVEAAFDTALKNREFTVWYQPKYDMRNRSICGAEALVRWRQQDGSIMPPGEFIPILEENGRIVELDEEVLRIVCRDMRDMERRGIPIKPVSVNLSKVHLKKGGVAERIISIVNEYQADRSKLSFEITESATFEEKEVLNRLVKQLQKEGFLVDMDDYGTGSSTLKSLSATNFNTLKLDKSFIDDIGTEKIDIILKSTIQMAKQLAMELVAEGVETEAQAKFLVENQCFVAQGYYFSKPLEREVYMKEIMKESNTRNGEIDMEKFNGGG